MRTKALVLCALAMAATAISVRTAAADPPSIPPRAATPAIGSTKDIVYWGRLPFDLEEYAHYSGSKHAAVWLGASPRVTVVARDWGEAYRLAGGGLGLLDSLRLSSSTRMVLTRVRFSDPRGTFVTPFAQLGAGQWRVDTSLLPVLQRDTEIASQLGGGIEMSLGGWQLAWENSATVLVRDKREQSNVSPTKLWSTTLASRVAF
jgi:hypothetical protein